MKKFLGRLNGRQKFWFFFLSTLNFLFFLLLFFIAGAGFVSAFTLFAIGQIFFILYYATVDNSKKKSKTREWVDAIVFAVIAATIIRTFFIEAFTIPTSSMEKSLLVGDFLFVSKVNYGARIPNTPLAFPFAHHTLPMTTNTKSYLEWIKLPYYRLPGFAKIKNYDVVVFNYPMEDFRPVDKQENYIKRCIAIPGDTLQINNAQVSINGKQLELPEYSQFYYGVRTDGSSFNPMILQSMDVTEGGSGGAPGQFGFFLTRSNAEKIKSFQNVLDVQPMFKPKGFFDSNLFPNDSRRNWNVDNYGPVIVPKRGMTMHLDSNNISIYRRVISVYEHNKLEEKDGKIFINDKETNSYTFQMDYYWMMGDNRHNSADSRYWGFVPQDHIVGKAVFVWMSWDTNGKFFNKIRWKRLFRFIH